MAPRLNGMPGLRGCIVCLSCVVRFSIMQRDSSPCKLYAVEALGSLSGSVILVAATPHPCRFGLFSGRHMLSLV